VQRRSPMTARDGRTSSADVPMGTGGTKSKCESCSRPTDDDFGISGGKQHDPCVTNPIFSCKHRICIVVLTPCGKSGGGVNIVHPAPMHPVATPLTSRVINYSFRHMVIDCSAFNLDGSGKSKIAMKFSYKCNAETGRNGNGASRQETGPILIRDPYVSLTVSWVTYYVMFHARVKLSNFVFVS